MGCGKCPGHLGSDTNQPVTDKGTTCCNESANPLAVGAELRADPLTPLQTKMRRVKDWFSELNEAGNMFGWWMIGSPSLGARNGGDLVFGPGDDETKHMRETAAYQEAVQIYREWLANGRPAGKFSIRDTDCEWVPSKGYFYVKGRSGNTGQTGNWKEPLAHPLWGYTGNFSIRFTESGWPRDGYVNVELENYTSLPSYFHGVAPNEDDTFLNHLYTKSSGVPMLSRSRQRYLFSEYIPTPSASTKPQPQSSGGSTYTVVAGDSLSLIAKTLYGDMSLWPILYDANRATVGPDYDKIEVGQSLVIPSKAKLTPEQMADAKRRAQRWHPSGHAHVTPPR
jgi:LysM repeat protein